MTNQQHPTTPPPELVQQWMAAYYSTPVVPSEGTVAVAIRAAQWGADQELEACCAFAADQSWGLVNGPQVADVIRAARRPKPPSLKERLTVALYNENIGEALRLVRQLDD